MGTSCSKSKNKNTKRVYEQISQYKMSIKPGQLALRWLSGINRNDPVRQIQDMVDASWDFFYEGQNVQFGHKTDDGSIVFIFGMIRGMNRPAGFCVVDASWVVHNGNIGSLNVQMKVSPLILKPI